MCGIIGILSRDSLRKTDLQAGLKALHHRGPDGTGIWVSQNGKTGLGHARLSIIDLATGQQPLVNETGHIRAVVNGEFYDYEDIRQNLEDKGHQFATRSDSEILIHLYEEYGTDCLQYLRGEFSFLLWDDDKEWLFAARDRFGIKPLCYAETAQGFFIASEAKALFAAGVPAVWDSYAFYHAASMQYVPQDRTLFDNVAQLKPGHMLVFKNGHKTISKYWDLDYLPEADTDNRSEAEWVDVVAEKFSEAVRLRLRADVPVCFHLSGGLDSSAVLGLAASESDKPLDAFTVSFSHDGYDEYAVAAESAAHNGANLHVVNVSQDDLVRELPDAVYYGEGLAVNGHLAAKYILNRHIRARGFKVALTGEGADEVFAGYPHLRQDLLASGTVNENTALQMQKLYASNLASTGVQLAYGAELPTAAVANSIGHVPSFLAAKAALGNRIHHILSDRYKDDFSKTDCYADLMRAVPQEQLQGKHPVNNALYLWTKLTLANYILKTLGDGMEMAHSIEGRLPFLDHHLFETVRRMPLSMKIKGVTEKFVLREAVRPHITDRVYRREKHPFMAPPVSVYSNDGLNGFIQDSIRSESFNAVPFFNRKKIIAALDKLPQEDAKSRTAMEPVLMTVLTAHLVQQKFGLAEKTA
jgi:asparagine synthase (glutamine-hydrolysing)